MPRPIFLALCLMAATAQSQTPAPRPAPAPVTPAAPTAPVVVPDVYLDMPFEIDVPVDVDAVRAQVAQVADMAGVIRASVDAATMALPAALSAMSFGMHDRFLDARPPAPWIQGDPADSLYRVARQAINRGDYRHAAQLFAELTQRYPKSAYAPTAAYYEAFARYRIGTTEELRSAARVLEALNARDLPDSREVDVAALAARINGTLAQRGDREAAAKVAQQAKQAGTNSCDRDEAAVRVEALSALDRMDRAAALPLIERVLKRRDECSTELRRRAVFMLVRDRTDSSAYPILLDVAKKDPNSDVRSEAVMWLSRLPTDDAVNALESLTRDGDERVRRTALRALMANESPRAKQALRGIIQRKETSRELRIDAIAAFARGDRATADDASFLKSVYPTAADDETRTALIASVARIDSTSAPWVLSIAKNADESENVRTYALAQLGRMPSVSIGDLVKLYDAAGTRATRNRLIGVFSVRKEPQATDKLLDIARSGTDPYARRMAINALSRKNDPRTTKLLLELVEKP